MNNPYNQPPYNIHRKERGKQKSRRILLFLILIWLFPALACNFPRPVRARRDPVSIAFEETVSALRTVITPAPATTAVPPPAAQTPIPSLSQNPASPSVTPVIPTQDLPATPGIEAHDGWFTYISQSGDTLNGLALRFGVETDQITSRSELPSGGLIAPGQTLDIPDQLGPTASSSAVLPDSEVIDSPSVASFQVDEYARKAGGFLSTYSEIVNGEQLSGAEIVQQVALETSINPLLLLALLEYRSHWVFGQPEDRSAIDYPIGFESSGSSGLYKELMLTAKQLNTGYYGWRAGTFTLLKFPGGGTDRMSPGLNAGSVAIQGLFMLFYREGDWLNALYGPDGFIALHRKLFGDPWARAASVEPIFPSGITLPTLELPFLPGERWSFTSGPHPSFATGSPLGAVDFAPVTGEPACSVSRAWVTASAPGIVARSDHGLLALDLDEDGKEQTGWVLIYLHLAERGRLPVGTRVNTDDQLGHPSCEGGAATGSHVHFAIKYNGEWIPAAGPLPMVLSGWTVQAGSRSYEGSLTKDGQSVTARPDGSHTSIIVR